MSGNSEQHKLSGSACAMFVDIVTSTQKVKIKILLYCIVSSNK